ncbi:MAG: LLM class flavin-dependent oxidoreductase [Acidimicrobiales bacterium]
MRPEDLLRGDAVSFGFITAGGPLAGRLEDMGADSLWTGGHIASANPSPEAMVGLARLVEQTTEVAVGTAILLLPLYPPALVAKQVADLDGASGGRLALGVGIGGEYPQEFRATGVPLTERGARLDEAIPLLRRLWSAEEISHGGRFYAMDDVRIHPAPRQGADLPVIVAGRQEPAMRRAARLGDGWMPYMYSPRRYRESVATVRQCADAAGRDLSRFCWSLFLPVNVQTDGPAARREAAAFLGGTYAQSFEEMISHVGAAGSPDEVAGRLSEYREAGVRHFVFMVCSHGDTLAQARVLIDDVVARLR